MYFFVSGMGGMTGSGWGSEQGGWGGGYGGGGGPMRNGGGIVLFKSKCFGSGFIQIRIKGSIHTWNRNDANDWDFDAAKKSLDPLKSYMTLPKAPWTP